MKTRGIAVLALAAAAITPFANPAANDTPQKVTMMFPASRDLPNVTAFQLARYKHYYEDARLNVQFLEGKGGVYAARQVGAAHADFGDVFGDTVIVERSHGLPLKMVAMLGGRGPTIFVSRSDSGITKLQDLKGRSISILGYEDSTYYVLLAALATANLTKADVNIKAAGAPGVIQDFIDGKVQVCACIPEWIVAAENAGLKLNLMPASNYVPILGPSIVTSDQMLADHPDIVRRFVQATLKAYVDLRDHPEESAKLYAMAVPSHKGHEADLARIYRYYAKFAWKDQPIAGGIDSGRLMKLQDVYFDRQIITVKSPLTDLFTDRFFKEAQ